LNEKQSGSSQQSALKVDVLEVKKKQPIDASRDGRLVQVVQAHRGDNVAA